MDVAGYVERYERAESAADVLAIMREIEADRGLAEKERNSLIVEGFDRAARFWWPQKGWEERKTLTPPPARRERRSNRPAGVPKKPWEDRRVLAYQ